MFRHVIVLQRNVNGRIHTCRLSGMVRTHVDLILEVIERGARRKCFFDPDPLIDQIVSKN